MNHTIILLYAYIEIRNPHTLRDELFSVTSKLHLTGRIIVSKEGINITLEGYEKDIDTFCSFLRKKKEFSDVDIKESVGKGDAFPRLSVVVKDEIVNTRFENHINPTKKTGKHISPQSLHRMYEKGEDVVVIDMRNAYEYKVGHFEKSIHPDIDASRDLPKKMDMLAPYKNKKVVTVCTGGVRCEKMSAYLLEHGFSDVSQLKGGIHRYLDTYTRGFFIGALYTFDNRVVMDWTKKREVVGRCCSCNCKTEIFTHCANAQCHAHLLVCKECLEKENIFCSNECRENPVRITAKKQLKEHLDRVG